MLDEEQRSPASSVSNSETIPELKADPGKTEQGQPMSRADYLLSHLAQECCEVAVRCTKAQMFGLDEIQPGQEFTNRERIMHELCDILALGETLRDEGILTDDVLPFAEVDRRAEAKKKKAATFSDYSRELGRLVTREEGQQ